MRKTKGKNKMCLKKMFAIGLTVLALTALAPLFIPAGAAQTTAGPAETETPPLSLTEAVQRPGGRSIVYATTPEGSVYVIDAETGEIELLSHAAAVEASAAAPTFSPAAGTYNTAQTITLRSSTPGASIYFSVNGSTPTTSSSLYRAPFSATTNTTIKAITVAKGFANSSVASATYTIESLTWPASGTSLGTYSRSNFFPPHVLSDIPVPQAVDTRPEALPSYRILSVAGANGTNVTNLCNLGLFNGSQVTLQCNPAIPVGTNIVTIQASDAFSSVLGIFSLLVTK
jgi:hypothetical protein